MSTAIAFNLFGLPRELRNQIYAAVLDNLEDHERRGWSKEMLLPPYYADWSDHVYVHTHHDLIHRMRQRVSPKGITDLLAVNEQFGAELAEEAVRMQIQVTVELDIRRRVGDFSYDLSPIGRKRERMASGEWSLRRLEPNVRRLATKVELRFPANVCHYPRENMEAILSVIKPFLHVTSRQLIAELPNLQAIGIEFVMEWRSIDNSDMCNIVRSLEFTDADKSLVRGSGYQWTHFNISTHRLRTWFGLKPGDAPARAQADDELRARSESRATTATSFTWVLALMNYGNGDHIALLPWSL